MTVGQKFLLFLQNRVFRTIVLMFSLVLAAGVVRSVVTIWQKRGLVAQRQAVLKAEQIKHAELEQKLQEATSAAFIERAAREKLGLAREGETVVILDKTKLQNENQKSPETSKLPSWKQWWRLFF